jgi:hypothetical protein
MMILVCVGCADLPAVQRWCIWHIECRGARGNQVPDKRLSVLLTEQQQRKIDEWRRKQPDLPNLSDSIRRLIDLALKDKSR